MTQIIKRLNLHIFLYGSILLMVWGCTKGVTDDKVYNSIKIGNQIWMTENLSVTVYQNGDSINNIKTASDWEKLNTGAYCDFNNNVDSGKIYGHLYNYYAVIDSRKIAPKGWRVATKEDWDTLVQYLKTDSAGIKLREVGTKHWKCVYCTSCFFGNNVSGFTALAASYRGNNGQFPSGPGSDLGNGTSWWAVSNNGNLTDMAEYFALGTCYPGIYNATASRKYGYSVRCIKEK